MRNNKGMVSVIITSYNSEKFLERSVFSVLNQTYKKRVNFAPEKILQGTHVRGFFADVSFAFEHAVF